MVKVITRYISGLFGPSLEISEKKKERKKKLPLLDLSASPQVTSCQRDSCLLEVFLP